ncbi:MAG: pilin, partial [Candidatus Nomurabacteria bacterium]|nr:pilin [Candidatus Nomurabacteria bacterium]
MSRILGSVTKLRAGVAVMALSACLALTLPGSANGLSLMDVINGSYRGQGQPTDLFAGGDALIPRLINLMLFIVGILAIVFLIFGGIRYVISGGDKGKVDAAKNTILYAIVGLVVAILGYAVVNWVIGVV